jgi:aminoglycoside 6'-N-acetyltransferase
MDRRPAPPTLTGPRVTLRAATPVDAPAVLRVLRAHEVARWWPLDDDAEALALCDGSDPDLEVWAIVVAGAVEGVIQAWEETDPDYRHAGVDLALHPSVQGRGLGPDAIRLVARYLFEERGHHRLTIDPNRANERAIAAYRSVGFREVGVLRSVEWDRTLGRWTDGLLMDLLAGELLPDPAAARGPDDQMR